MKKIMIVLAIIIVIAGAVLFYFMLTHSNEKGEETENNEELNTELNKEEVNHTVEKEEEKSMKLSVSDGNNTIIFELNDTPAARSLFDQLPLEIEVQNFSSSEKIFYPPERLDVSDTPRASGGRGVLAYYTPWSDVVMFYDSFNENNSLYELGYAIEGESKIENLSGNLTIEKVENE